MGYRAVLQVNNSRHKVMSVQSQPPFQFANFFAHLNVANHWQGRGIGFVQSSRSFNTIF